MLTMRHLFVSLLFCSATIHLSGAQTTTGDTLWNWAVSGLKLREKPGVQAKRIAGIPYGEKVRIMEDGVSATAHTQKTCASPATRDCYTLKGKWVKVEYAGKTGFVFDVYLSRQPAQNLIRSKPGEGPSELERLQFYLKKNFGTVSADKRQDKDGIKYVDVLFNSNIRMQQRYYKTAFEEIDLNLPGWKFNEAYLLANHIFSLESGGISCSEQSPNELVFKNEGQTVKISTDATGSRITFGSYD